MSFDEFHGEIVITDGRAELRDVAVAGPAARIVAEGSATLRGDLDVAVHPHLGRGLTRLAEGTEYIASLLDTADGFLAFPIDITVKGLYSDPVYGVRTRSRDLIHKTTGIVTDTVGGVFREGKSFVEDTMEEGPVTAIGDRLKRGGSAATKLLKEGGGLVGDTLKTGGEKAVGVLKGGEASEEETGSGVAEDGVEPEKNEQ